MNHQWFIDIIGWRHSMNLLKIEKIVLSYMNAGNKQNMKR